MDRLKELICSCGAAKAGIISFSDCDIINPRVLDKMSFVPQSVIVGILPYYTHYCDLPKTVSAYALAYDYHLFIRELCENILDKAQQMYPSAHFSWFADHSPINEKLAAAKAGLGIIGEHSLLITPEYSSYVFLFEIFTDLVYHTKPHTVQGCERCEKCLAACPADLYDKTQCLSAITQKKGNLNQKEVSMIAEAGCVWGCDICQRVCPHTVKAIESGSIYSEIDWFNYNIKSAPTQESILDSEDFSKRAYSWRGTATILRNIDILKHKDTKS